MPENPRPSKTALGTVVELKYTLTEAWVEDKDGNPESYELSERSVLGKVHFHNDDVIVLNVGEDEKPVWRIFDLRRCQITFYHPSGGQSEG